MTAGVTVQGRFPTDEAVALHIVADGVKYDFKRPLPKGAQFRHRIQPRFIHIDHHVPDDRSKAHASGSYLVGNTNPCSVSYHIEIDSPRNTL